MGVILAGGRATRMGGGDKGLLPLAGQPMLAHVVARLAPQVAALALNANGDPARFADFGLPVLPDPPLAGVPDFPGPLAGVLAGMEWAAMHGAGALLTVAADTPFLPADLVARLSSGRITQAAGLHEDGTQRPHPTIGLWPITLREALRQALQQGERRVGRWAATQGAQAVVFDDQPDPFFNVNTPEDLRRAEARLSAS